LTDICFYSKDEKICLIVKPELATLMEASSIKVEKDKDCFRARCRSCSNNVGCQIPYGPNGAKYIALGTEKVVICDVILKRRDRWKEKVNVHPFSTICTRDEKSFHGVAQTINTEVAPSRKKKIAPLTLANYDIDFEWKHLLRTKVPRRAQVEAYLEALQRDCIVVMPTGFGKTLIASMVMRKLSQLNPTKVAVMIVDRIPLVFQQAKAIEMDTGVRIDSMPINTRDLEDLVQVSNIIRNK